MNLQVYGKKKGKAGFTHEKNLELLARASACFVVIDFLWFADCKSFGQEKKFTFSFKHVPINSVYLHMRRIVTILSSIILKEVQRIGLKDYKFENASIRGNFWFLFLKGTDLTCLKFEINILIYIESYQKNGPGEDVVVVRGKVVQVLIMLFLPGVTVLLKGTVTGVTNRCGRQVFNFCSLKRCNFDLLFRRDEAKEVICGDKREINVTLEEDVQAMERVVVMGYQTLRKE